MEPAKLSEAELKEFREIFNLVDKDGGGTISKKELGELMDTLGIHVSAEEIDLMVHEIDSDQNGEIDFNEFVMVLSRRTSSAYTAAQIKGAFRLFQGDAPAGYIHVDDVVRALCHFGSEKLSEAQARELAAQLEPDGRGMVNFETYVDMMMPSASAREQR